MWMSVALSAIARAMISFTNFMIAAFSSSSMSPSPSEAKAERSFSESEPAPTPKVSAIFSDRAIHGAMRHSGALPESDITHLPISLSGGHGVARTMRDSSSETGMHAYSDMSFKESVLEGAPRAGTSPNRPRPEASAAAAATSSSVFEVLSMTSCALRERSHRATLSANSASNSAPKIPMSRFRKVVSSSGIFQKKFSAPAHYLPWAAPCWACRSRWRTVSRTSFSRRIIWRKSGRLPLARARAIISFARRFWSSVAALQSFSRSC